MSKLKHLSDLFPEIVMEICLFLPHDEKFKMPMVSRSFRQILEGTPYFWRSTLEQICPYMTQLRSKNSTRSLQYWKTKVLFMHQAPRFFPHKENDKNGKSVISPNGCGISWEVTKEGTYDVGKFCCQLPPKGKVLMIFEIQKLYKTTFELFGMELEERPVDLEPRKVNMSPFRKVWEREGDFPLRNPITLQHAVRRDGYIQSFISPEQRVWRRSQLPTHHRLCLLFSLGKERNSVTMFNDSSFLRQKTSFSRNDFLEYHEDHVFCEEDLEKNLYFVLQIRMSKLGACQLVHFEKFRERVPTKDQGKEWKESGRHSRTRNKGKKKNKKRGKGRKKKGEGQDDDFYVKESVGSTAEVQKRIRKVLSVYGKRGRNKFKENGKEKDDWREKERRKKNAKYKKRKKWKGKKLPRNVSEKEVKHLQE